MNKLNVNIAFDIDGIVANFSDPFQVWASEKYGLAFAQTGKFHWQVMPEIPEKMFKEIIAEFISYGEPEITLLDGALAVDYVWSKCHEPILFVTARDISTAGDTYEWIAEHFPCIDFMLSIASDSAAKYRLIGKYGAFIDDRRKTAVDLANSGKIVFMPMRSYNELGSMYQFPIFTPDYWGSTVFENTADLSRGAIILLEEASQLTSGEFDHIIYRQEPKPLMPSRKWTMVGPG